MKETTMPHEGHEEHLCYLHDMGVLAEKPEEYKKLVRNAKYICTGCGRTAANAKNVCVPAALEPAD